MDSNITQCYCYNENMLTVTTKDGIKFLLKLRKNITVVTGDSATGKTYLVNYISDCKIHGTDKRKEELKNVYVIDNKELIRDEKCLYIIDRGDKVLDDSFCEKIVDCVFAHFLIFARGAYNLYITPNQEGVFIYDSKNNLIKIEYAFHSPRW